MHVAFKSSRVQGAITAAQIVEGLAVTLTDSGVVNGFYEDTPLAELAASGTHPVYIVEASPDDFPRPVDLRQYRAGWYTHLGREDSDYSDPVETLTRYNVGIANHYNPTIPSGFLVACHRGGTYTVPAACYVDSAGIKVPDNYIEVGDNGKWQYTANRDNAVGEVVSWNSSTSELTFVLWF